MYEHLLKIAHEMQLKAIETCGSDAELTAGEKTFPGKIVFLIGRMPPVKIRLPQRPGKTPATQPDLQQIKLQLMALIPRVKEVEKRLDAIPVSRKVAHPALGYLNAKEWFAFIEMHFRHHLRQKKRIDSFLRG